MSTVNTISANVGASATKVNMIIEQGATFDVTVTWQNPDTTPVDLSGYAARMQIRDTADDTIVVELLSTNAVTLPHIIVTGVAGTVQMIIPSDATEALTFTTGRYDLELYTAASPPYVVRLMRGIVTLNTEVTR